MRSKTIPVIFLLLTVAVSMFIITEPAYAWHGPQFDTQDSTELTVDGWHLYCSVRPDDKQYATALYRKLIRLDRFHFKLCFGAVEVQRYNVHTGQAIAWRIKPGFSIWYKRK